jgi:acyl carrier protein
MADKNTTVEGTLRKLVVKATHNNNIVLTPNCTFKDLGVDSLSVVSILVSLEDSLNIDIEDEDLKSLHTMEAFIDYLKKKVAEKEAIERAESRRK